MRRNTFLIMKQKLQLLPHFLRDDRLFMLLQYFVSLSYVVLEFFFFFLKLLAESRMATLKSKFK